MSEKKDQKAMFYHSHKKIAEANQFFLDRVKEGMTRGELEKLIQKRPSLWGRFSSWLEKLPNPLNADEAQKLRAMRAFADNKANEKAVKADKLPQGSWEWVEQASDEAYYRGIRDGIKQSMNVGGVKNPFVRVAYPSRTARLFRMKKTGRWAAKRRRNSPWKQTGGVHIDINSDNKTRRNPITVALEGTNYEVEIMDSSHLKMRPVGSDRWGIPLHVLQVPHEVMAQLKEGGRVRGTFLRENPLTWDEARKLEHERLIAIRRGLKASRKKMHKLAAFNLGKSEGLATAINQTGYRLKPSPLAHGMGTPGYPPLRTVRKIKLAEKLISKIPNPATARLIGRKVILVKTTSGVLGNPTPSGRRAANGPSLARFGGLYGLKDGSVLIRGFFPAVPGGTVTRVEYLDEAKAKREGLKNPCMPWRHDFSAERRPLRRVRGGLLIPASKRPLWGLR